MGRYPYEKDQKGRKQIDVSELERVYEQLRTQNGTHPPTDELRRPVRTCQRQPPKPVIDMKMTATSESVNEWK